MTDSNSAGWVGNPFSDGAGDAASTGQKFALDVTEVRARLAYAEEMSKKLNDMAVRAGSLQQVTPPSQDQVSKTYNQRLTTTGDSGFIEGLNPFGGALDEAVTRINAQVKYMDSWVVKLQKALGIYKETDHENKTSITNAGKPPEPESIA